MPESAPSLPLADTILVVSAVIHHRHEGRLYGYTPYVREVDAWSHLFTKVRIAGPLVEGSPPSDCAPFRSDNVELVPLPATGGGTWAAKAMQIIRIPELVIRLAAQMRRADAIQVRCPSNLGLLAVPMAPLFSRRIHCKYAGMWGGFNGEPWSSHVQRWVLRSRWWKGPVSVYGQCPDDPPKIHATFSTALRKSQIDRTPRRTARSQAIRLVFVGRLTAAKNVDVVLQAVANVNGHGLECTLAIIGDGPERRVLERLASELGVNNVVTFYGGLPMTEVVKAYAQSDVLTLVSESEGWPKAIVEAMAFGVVPVGNNRGMVPTIVADGRGLAIPPRDVVALERAIIDLTDHPCQRAEMALRSQEWAQQFTLERFAADHAAILDISWPWGNNTRQGRRQRKDA